MMCTAPDHVLFLWAVGVAVHVSVDRRIRGIPLDDGILGSDKAELLRHKSLPQGMSLREDLLRRTGGVSRETSAHYHRLSMG